MGPYRAPAMSRILRPPTRRSQSFWGRYELGRDGGGEFERVGWLVVGDAGVESVEQVGEVVCAVAGERGAQVGDRGEHCFDLVRLRFVGAMRRELVPLVVERGPLSCEFFDTWLCRRDDGMTGRQRPIDVLQLSGELGDRPL
jgi:hypothetical protein